MKANENSRVNMNVIWKKGKQNVIFAPLTARGKKRRERGAGKENVVK